MDTKTLHQSSWGRILLMLRADLVTHKTTLLVFFAAFIGLAYFLPRLPFIINQDYSGFLHLWSETYVIGVANAVNSTMAIASTILYFVYVNRRIIHSTPTLFSTIPASLWEKVTSVLLYGLIIHILATITTLLSQALEIFTVPMPIQFTTMWETYYYSLLKKLEGAEWYEGLAVIGFIVAPLAITFWCSIKLRNIFLGLVLSSVIQIGLLTLLIAAFVNYTKNLTGDLDAELSSLGAIFTWTASIIFIYLSYKKLRSIAS